MEPLLARRKPVWAVLISGRGSNLGALLDLQHEIDLRLVVSSSSRAHGLLRARRAGVRTLLAPTVDGRKIEWLKLKLLLEQNSITHLCLLGFMKVLPALMVERWQNSIINLHPSLLPLYPGLRSIERGYEDQVAMGVTVHEVNEQIDEGQIVIQRRSLNAAEVRGYSLARAELYIHLDEQRLIKEAVRRWPSRQTP